MPAITILIAPLRLQYDQMIAPTHLLSQPDNDRADTPAIYERDTDRAYTPAIQRPIDRLSFTFNHYHHPTLAPYCYPN